MLLLPSTTLVPWDLVPSVLGRCLTSEEKGHAEPALPSAGLNWAACHFININPKGITSWNHRIVSGKKQQRRCPGDNVLVGASDFSL